MKVAPLGRLGSVVWFGAMPARDMIGGEAFVNRELPSRSDASNHESCGFPGWRRKIVASARPESARRGGRAEAGRGTAGRTGRARRGVPPHRARSAMVECMGRRPWRGGIEFARGHRRYVFSWWAGSARTAKRKQWFKHAQTAVPPPRRPHLADRRRLPPPPLPPAVASVAPLRLRRRPRATRAPPRGGWCGRPAGPARRHVESTRCYSATVG